MFKENITHSLKTCSICGREQAHDEMSDGWGVRFEPGKGLLCLCPECKEKIEEKSHELSA